MKPPYSPKTFLPILLLTLGLAFGLFIPFLGFYQDDWHPVFYGYARGLDSLSELFIADGRPLVAYLFQAGFRLFGFGPLAWQIVALGLRSLSVVFFWLLLREVWPARPGEAAWAALLFSVYPLFDLQPLALIYTIHWSGLALYLASLWTMARALRHPAQAGWLLPISWLASGLHLLLLEYYAGIELIRPLLIYLLTPPDSARPARRLSASLRLWSPYLLWLAVFFLYRFYLIPRPESGELPNAPTLLIDLLRAPLATLPELVNAVLQDSVRILFSAWSKPINPELFQITRPLNVLALLLIGGLAAILYAYSARQEQPDSQAAAWHKTALGAGLAWMLLGPIPGWVTRQGLGQSNPLWSSRFGLAAMLGASLFLTALVGALAANRRYRNLLLSLLVAFAAGGHFIRADAFRAAWDKQVSFYQQLTWRAPYILPDTALISDGEFLTFMGDYPLAFALGVLYPRRDDSNRLPYWAFNLRSEKLSEALPTLAQGAPLWTRAYSMAFSGNSAESLVISFEPESGRCLWVLRPQDAELRLISDLTRQAAGASNLGRILPAAQAPFPAHILRQDAPKTWCYYYQKADLARQLGDWPAITRLWQAAGEQGFRPANGVEYLPFIEAYAHLQDWPAAARLTEEANQPRQGMRPALCALWQQVVQSAPASPEQAAAYQQVQADLSCP
jgi:hypothetical protein